LQSQYPYGAVTNRFYVYRDDLAATAANNLDDTTLMSDFTATTACSTAGILPRSSQKGWFMNLTQYGVGEPTVTSALIAAGMVAFSTNRPIPAAAGSCTTTLGEARGYWVNLFNGSGAVGVTGACGGTRSGIFVGGGLPLLR
jgi:type IV pilus assembly protein PilY1